jgi:hypothetical protein
MNKIVVHVLSVVVVVGLLSSAWAKEVPLKGNYADRPASAVPVDPDHVFVTTAGGGHLTHFGKFEFVSPHLSGLSDLTVVGEQTLTAANGDSITGEFNSQLTPSVTPDGHVFLVGDIEVTIVSGTGRFANATGSYIFSITFDTATLESVATIRGTIDYSGK